MPILLREGRRRPPWFGRQTRFHFYVHLSTINYVEIILPMYARRICTRKPKCYQVAQLKWDLPRKPIDYRRTSYREKHFSAGFPPSSQGYWSATAGGSLRARFRPSLPGEGTHVHVGCRPTLFGRSSWHGRRSPAGSRPRELDRTRTLGSDPQLRLNSKILVRKSEMVNLVNALQCAGHTVASSRAEHGLSETLSVAMCSRADGAGGRCGAHTYSQILVLFLASVQVALVDSASTFGVPITRGIDVVGGASPISPPDDIASTTMSDTKKIRRKVRRKVKRRRKVSRSRSATSDAALDAATEQMHVSNAEETSTSTIPTLHSVSNGEESIAATSMRPTTAALVQDSAKNATDPSNLAFIGESLDSAAPTVPRKQQSPKKKTRKDPALAQRSGKANIVQDKKRAVGGGKEGECLRRIKREWKDAVALGIAYDWGKMKTVKRKGKKSSKSSTDPKYNYVRMGPMGKNLLSWHFSVQGAPNSVYAEGIYHGRVLLPKDYPASPPRVQMLTPSGRFVTGEDICLSASSYHPESWTPRWTVLSLIDALRLHMLTSANEIGGVHATNEVRKERAKESRTWRRGVVNHARMAEAGIFSLDDAESSSPYSTDCKENHTQPSLANAPSDEEILGMVTANAIQRHTERTARAMERRPSASKLFLLVKIVFRLTISVLTNPWKLALAIFTAIFAYLNSR